MVDFSTHKLGSHNDLKMTVQKTFSLDTVPPAFGRMEGSVPILGHNDKVGDCCIVAMLNYIRATYARQGLKDPITDDLALDVYAAITGYDPKDPATDRGTNPEAALAYWQNNSIAGAKLNSFTRIDHGNEFALRNSIVKTGGVFLCVELSTAQQQQEEWLPVGVPGSWGGHGIISDSYAGGAYYIITWGKIMSADRSYFNTSGFLVGAYELDITLEAK